MPAGRHSIPTTRRQLESDSARRSRRSSPRCTSPFSAWGDARWATLDCYPQVPRKMKAAARTLPGTAGRNPDDDVTRHHLPRQINSGHGSTCSAPPTRGTGTPRPHVRARRSRGPRVVGRKSLALVTCRPKWRLHRVRCRFPSFTGSADYRLGTARPARTFAKAVPASVARGDDHQGRIAGSWSAPRARHGDNIRRCCWPFPISFRRIEPVEREWDLESRTAGGVAGHLAQIADFYTRSRGASDIAHERAVNTAADVRNITVRWASPATPAIRSISRNAGCGTKVGRKRLHKWVLTMPSMRGFGLLSRRSPNSRTADDVPVVVRPSRRSHMGSLALAKAGRSASTRAIAAPFRRRKIRDHLRRVGDACCARMAAAADYRPDDDGGRGLISVVSVSWLVPGVVNWLARRTAKPSTGYCRKRNGIRRQGGRGTTLAVFLWRSLRRRANYDGRNRGPVPRL